jgi:F0F1-type ATP synthase assembly protein I
MPEEPKSGSGGSNLAGIGFEFVGAVVGFTFFGYLWDRYFGSRPWGLLIGALLGLIGGTYNLIRQTLAANRGSGGEEGK